MIGCCDVCKEDKEVKIFEDAVLCDKCISEVEIKDAVDVVGYVCIFLVILSGCFFIAGFFCILLGFLKMSIMLLTAFAVLYLIADHISFMAMIDDRGDTADEN